MSALSYSAPAFFVEGSAPQPEHPPDAGSNPPWSALFRASLGRSPRFVQLLEARWASLRCRRWSMSQCRRRKYGRLKDRRPRFDPQGKALPEKVAIRVFCASLRELIIYFFSSFNTFFVMVTFLTPTSSEEIGSAGIVTPIRAGLGRLTHVAGVDDPDLTARDWLAAAHCASVRHHAARASSKTRRAT